MFVLFSNKMERKLKDVERVCYWSVWRAFRRTLIIYRIHKSWHFSFIFQLKHFFLFLSLLENFSQNIISKPWFMSPIKISGIIRIGKANGLYVCAYYVFVCAVCGRKGNRGGRENEGQMEKNEIRCKYIKGALHYVHDFCDGFVMYIYLRIVTHTQSRTNRNVYSWEKKKGGTGSL